MSALKRLFCNELMRRNPLIATGSLAMVLAAAPCHARAQGAANSSTGKTAVAAPQQPDLLHRKLTRKELKEQRAKLKHELSDTYKKWLNEDVVYIITDEERKAFMQLQTDEERDQFIEAFWQRRNPNPDAPYNEYKEEHYRRIAYANEHFAAGVPGWRTDRGRIYITFGAPDEIESHPSGGTYLRPEDEGGGETSTFPFEDWRYRYIDGIGQEVIWEFVDTCMCGEYHLTMDPSEKDALLYVPGAGLSDMEAMGMASKNDRFTRADGTHLPMTSFTPESMDEFNRLEMYTAAFRPPKVKFKDLQEIVTSNITYNLLPFSFRTDFVKVTDDTVLVPITVQIADRNITFQEHNGVQQGRINVFGRLSTMTGRTVDTFEEPVSLDLPAELLSQYMGQTARYWHGALLKPGRYRLDLVLKDVNSPDRMGTIRQAITVPVYTDDKLEASSIMLADQIQKVPSRQVGAGEFIVGDTKVRPVVGALFSRNQTMGIWMQVYNLKVDQKTHKPSAVVDWQITKADSNQAILDHKETTDRVSNAAEQVTLEKTLPLQALQPGVYRLTVKVTDNLGNQSISPQTTFTVQ
jgi:GWxTD domain-containing protein